MKGILYIFLLCFIGFANTLDNSWHLDDFLNIIYNPHLHIDNLHHSTLLKTFYAHPDIEGAFFRPISNLSFSINWFFHQDSVRQYHLINIVIHCLTAIVLYFCCVLLLKSPASKSQYHLHSYPIALLTSSLWLINPIQSQAVNYIVQRMAQLSTFFTISAILFYLLGRKLTFPKTKLFFIYICCFFCFLMAVGSKENGILIPFSLLLIELIFFTNNISFASIIRKNKLYTTIIILFFSLIGLLIYNRYGISLLDYGHRNFSLIERLLTESRIVIFHLSQIFFPLPSRFSIEHDIVISQSLFAPITTLYSILLIGILIVFCIYKRKKYPLFVFSILFYFLNHAVESTIIPLELVFEHRNYLPSLFLFLPIAALISHAITCKSNYIKFFIVLITSLFIVLSGYSTYNRNQVWSSEESLWSDAVSKAPNSSRARLNLATQYLQKNRLDEALTLCHQAEKLSSHSATKNKILPVSFVIQSDIVYKMGDLNLAINYLRQALLLRDDYTDAANKLINLLIMTKQYDEALVFVNNRFEKTNDPNLLISQGSILLHLDLPNESLEVYNRAEIIFPHLPQIILGKAKALSLLGHYSETETLLSDNPFAHLPETFFLHVENSIRSGNTNQANIFISEMIELAPLMTILGQMNTITKMPYFPPYDIELIHQLFLVYLIESLRNED